jgi:hypothetical protein
MHATAGVYVRTSPYLEDWGQNMGYIPAGGNVYVNCQVEGDGVTIGNFTGNIWDQVTYQLASGDETKYVGWISDMLVDNTAAGVFTTGPRLCGYVPDRGTAWQPDVKTF